MRRAALAIVVLVVLSGCSSAIAPPGEASTPGGAAATNEPVSIAVRNGSVPIDQNALFEEVSALLATDADPPESIQVEQDSRMGIHREPMDPFFRLVGIDRPASASRTATALGVVGDPRTVHVHEKITADADQTRLTLAHEYVHVLQLRREVPDTLRSTIPDPKSTDATIVRHAVLEGTAVRVETQLWERYGGTGSSPAAGMERSYETSTGAKQWIYARYHFGYEYLQARNVSTTSVDDVYESPPRTSEELLHGMAGGSEPMPPLSVDVESEEWTVEERDRAGELFVRVALDTQVSTDEAADAAAGWGTDTRVALSNDGEQAYVWALRWDDAANATEFQDAFHDYLDERATREGSVWVDEKGSYTTTRVEDETIVVLLGPESFVRNATVDGSVDSVRVTT